MGVKSNNKFMVKIVYENKSYSFVGEQSFSSTPAIFSTDNWTHIMSVLQNYHVPTDVNSII